MTEENLEQKLNRKKKELRLENINIQTTRVDSWEDFEYLKKHLSNVDTEIVLPKLIKNIEFNISVSKNGKLILTPGTELTFLQETGLICTGQLLAEGNESENILFTGNPSWGNIFFKDSYRDSSLRYCIIEKGTGDKWYKVLKQMKITDSYGGGISILRSNVSIIDCKVNNNKSSYGGGIAANHAKIIVSDTALKNNQADLKHKSTIPGFEQMYNYGEGGAIYLKSSTATLQNNMIENNKSFGKGGGLSFIDSLVSFDDNIIRSNEANQIGGGIRLYKSSIVGNKNMIGDNGAKNAGGGIYLSKSDFDGNMNKIINNIAARGGGIYTANSKIIGMTNIVSKNIASVIGGGVYHETSLMNYSDFDKRQFEKEIQESCSIRNNSPDDITDTNSDAEERKKWDDFIASYK